MNERPQETGSAGSFLDKEKITGGQPNFFRKYFIDPFRMSNNPPGFDAMGVAVGMFAGLGVPVGLHMITIGLMRLAVRFHTIVAVGFACVNNPLTMIPLYYGFYLLGCLGLGEQAAMTVEDFRELMHPIIHASYFWEAVKRFGALGGDLLLKWTLGAMVVSLPVSVVSYIIAYRVLKARCMRKARKLGLTYERLLQRMEEERKAEMSAQ